jgi:hypothetical protein
MLVGTTAARNDADWRRSTLVPRLLPAAEQLQALIPDAWLAYLRPHEPPSDRPSSNPSPFSRPR